MEIFSLWANLMSSTADIQITIIDDDIIFCRSINRLLRTVGHWLMTFSSPDKFLTYFAHPRFDCIVLDLQLGGISALELPQN